MPPALAFDLVNLLEDRIMLLGRSRIPVHLQVLAALRYFAFGSYQRVACEDHRHAVSQPTFSRCLTRVATALGQIAADWIKLPSTPEERQRIANE